MTIDSHRARNVARLEPEPEQENEPMNEPNTNTNPPALDAETLAARIACAPNPFAVGDELRPVDSSETDIPHGRYVAVRTFHDAEGAPMVEYRPKGEVFELTLRTVSTDRFSKPALWNEAPAQWLREQGEDALREDSEADAPAARLAALDLILGAYVDGCRSVEGRAVRALLVACAGDIGYRVRASNAWIQYGPMTVPSSPNGIGTIRKLREESRTFARRSPRGLFDSSEQGAHVLSRFVEAHEKTAEGSALFGSLRNVSENGKGGAGIVLDVDLDSAVMREMPKGETLPAPILCALDGFEMKGGDALEIMREADMCAEGTVEFLDSFGISHEREGGEYECDSCGSYRDDDEGGEVSYIADFTIDADMISALDSAGFLDAVREAVGAENDSDSFETLLDSCDDAELRERLAPRAMVKVEARTNANGETKPAHEQETGIAYDTARWRFVPSFEDVEGAEELDFAYLARLLPALARSAQEHEARGILPAIPGTLERVRPSYNSHRFAEGASSFAWNPADGTLTHAVSSEGLRLVRNVRNGNTKLVLPENGGRDSLTVEAPNENGGRVSVRLFEAGALASEWFPLAQAEPTI